MIELSRSPSPQSSLDSSSKDRPVAIRQLKSSLKLNRSDSASVATSSTASSSLKNVRFAAELTTVKKFDSGAEPISISTENSPQLKPIGPASDEDIDDERDELWFNNLTLLPSLLKNKWKIGSKSGGKNRGDSLLLKCQLDYDSDSGLEDDEDDDEDANGSSVDKNCYEEKGPHQFEVVDWQLLQSNVVPFKDQDSNPFIKRKDEIHLESQLFDYLQGSNIRLHSLEQIDESFGKISGLIYVNNLNFEKFTEIKFTFDNWENIHHVSANYHKSITDRVDEFKFVIDLNVLKYSLQVRNLIYCNPALKTTLCPLDVEFCCRYDVNCETFYDNNNYENYRMKLVVTTQSKEDLDEEKAVAAASAAAVAKRKDELSTDKGNMFARDFLVTTTLSHSHRPLDSGVKPSDARKFSDDTDYYNTSPLRHLYHNDTSLIRPAKMNEMLIGSDYDNGASQPSETGDGPLNDINTANVDVPEVRSVSDSISSYSSVSSPSEDLNLMDNEDYYRYSSSNSLSSLELNSDLPINHFASTDIGLTLRSLTDEDAFDDVQSIITDTAGDVHHNSNLALRNNSAETLITPGAVQTLASSSHSRDLSSSQNNIVPGAESEGEPASQNKTASDQKFPTPTSTPTATIRPKDMDYQTFLNSYCFFNRPNHEVFEGSCDGAGSSPTIQAISPI